MSSYPTADGLTYLARELAQVAAKRFPKRVRTQDATLRPGPGTPMWNALVECVKPLLRRRGDKINLGRWLGVPPARITEYLRTHSSAPDAERTLLLLVWVAHQRARLARSQNT